MNRIAAKWAQLRREKRKALVAFVTAGDPNLEATEEIVLSLEKGGADIVELGVPFSDPMADGPVIQKASERALAQGVTLGKILDLVKRVRTKSQVPILLMGYYNPILSYGLKKYARAAAEAGVDATLVVDLPPEESEELDRELEKKGIDLIYLLSPTSDEIRIEKVVRKARGFLYFVSMTGVTGAALKSDQEIRRKIEEIRRKTDLPIAVGFGISNAEQATRIGALADGVVIGSALVNLVNAQPDMKAACARIESFLQSVRQALG